MEDASQPAVDIIIVNYRSYDELVRCLGSLESERAHVGRVVVIDHESDVSAASRVAGRFPWIDLVERATNEGFATGVNIGARRTHAPFLLLLNPDCIVTANAIPRMLDFARREPRAAVVGPRILNADGSVQGSARRFPSLTTAIAGRSSWLTRRFPHNPLSRHNLPALDADRPRDVDWVSGACMLVRRHAFDQIGGMDEGFFLYWEDADLCHRLVGRGWRTIYFPEPTIVHAGGRSSIHVYRESLIAFHRSAYRLFWKHAGLAGRLCAPVVHAGLQLRLMMMLRLYRRKLSRSQ